jgi:SAM-dependent methyltransferase
VQGDQYVNGAYLRKNPEWHEGDAPWKAAHVFRMISRHGLEFDTVCDVGCGSGGVLAELQKMMDSRTRFIGYDISPQAIALAKPRENDRLVFRNTDSATIEPSSRGLLLLLDVLEHVEDYIGFLRSMRSSAPWVILHIPLDMNVKAILRRSRWPLYMRHQYGHLHYFTRETALATLDYVGYDVVDWFYTDDKSIPEAQAPPRFSKRMAYEARRHLYRVHRDLAVSLFESFNLMVLARAEGASAPVGDSTGRQAG